MDTILTTLVGLAFLWSIVLFVMAVVGRGRHQEVGFGYSLVGAAAFGMEYCDRLPGRPLWPRQPLLLLPGVHKPNHLFSSSLIALLLIAIVYAGRVAVFVRLYMSSHPAPTSGYPMHSDLEDTLGDAVAPALAFLTLMIALVALLRGTYGLPPLGVAAVALGILALYYLRALRRILRGVVDLLQASAIMTMRLLRVLRRIPFYLILAIVRLEAYRRPDTASESALQKWVTRKLHDLDTEARTIGERERRDFTRAASRLRQPRQKKQT